MNYAELKTRYEKACNDYLLLFCLKEKYRFADAYWIGGDVGGVIDYNGSIFDFENIRLYIDTNAPKGSLKDYNDYCLFIYQLDESLPLMNYSSWLKGCPRLLSNKEIEDYYKFCKKNSKHPEKIEEERQKLRNRLLQEE